MFGSQRKKQGKESIEELQRAAEIQSLSPVDPKLELLDPNPNIHQLFQIFDKQFFWGKLVTVEVKWSPRMTQCAGICRYQTRSGYCTIGLSKPLLSLRPRKDLIETLLHEMIHAFLFVTHNNRDRDGHGPQFHKHMYRINDQIGSNISVYHTFKDEVRAQKVHVWRCEGPCKDRPPFYGYVRRSMNRAPGHHDLWHAEHKASCGGTFVKILEPLNFKSKKKGSKESKDKDKTDLSSTAVISSTPKITTMFPKISSSSQFNIPSSFTPFTGSGHRLGSSGTSSSLSTPASGAVPKSGSVSGSGVPKRKVTSSSPNKTSQEQKDISSYFTKSILDISSDSELLISSPPNKRKRSDPPKQKTKQSLACPICNETGFADLNMHANICLNNQLRESSKSDSKYWSTNNQNSIVVLDDSVEESPVSNIATSPGPSYGNTTSGKSRECPICGKFISSDMIRKHLNICIASIPDDFDDDLLIAEDQTDDKQTGSVKYTETLSRDSGTSNTVVVKDEVTCPICKGMFAESGINSHLDECLSFNEVY